MTRVLVVDDKEDNLYFLQALLTGNGYDVEVARHGAEALVRARQSGPDLVVSDLLMPVMDGYTLLRQWKADARLRRVPFIVYTATYTQPEDERLALDLGADAFILKPAEPDAFLEQLREVEQRELIATPVADGEDTDAEQGLLKTYSEALIRKLEEKTFQLEGTNEALQRDIAERQQIEAALRASEADVRLLIESIPHIVWIADAAGQHLEFNQRWVDHTGLSLAESIGQGWLTVVHAEDRARSAEQWDDATRTGTPYDSEYRLRRPDGTYSWMLGRARPLRDPTGAVVKWFGTATDIDEMKQAQARIGELARDRERATEALQRALLAEQQANVELRNVEQLRKSFLTAVSHELRTPLTVVLGLAESLDRHHEVLGDDQRRELTKRLQANARRLARLLEDLLDLNRLSSGNLALDASAQDLREVIAAAIREADADADAHPISVDVPPIMVHADSVRLGRVVANLLRNASVHTPPGTPIRISARARAGSVELRVVDAGPGVSDELKEQIFEPFEQGPSAPQHQPGTGIGLNLVREFVSLHGGRSWVEDTPGGGATFVVELPQELRA